MSKSLSTLIVLQITLMLVGCESSGTIRGVSEGRSVQMEYQQGFQENDGILKITMRNGETFSGKFVQKSSSKSGDELSIPLRGQSSDEDTIVLSDSTTVSSQADALLIGNKGNTMKCKFQLSDPESGIEGGGIGSCKTSTGKSINMTF